MGIENGLYISSKHERQFLQLKKQRQGTGIDEVIKNIQQKIAGNF